MNKSRFRLISLVLFLLCFARCPEAKAKRIFLLVAADTSPAMGKLALSTGPDMDNMSNVFYANVPDKQLVVYGDNPGWNGPDIRNDLADMRSKLLTAIDNCPAGHDDTIVFFYSGHGAYDSDKGHYILMPDRSNSLLRKDIIRRIQNKNPRLVVVITDSCNTPIPLLAPPMICRPCITLEPTVSPLFDELFLKTKGIVDVNSSSKDQIAAGPAGGGLLVLAMAHMGNTPDFKETNFKGIEVIQAPGVSIASVDYHEAIFRQFNLDDDHDNLFPKPEEPPYGFLYANSGRSLSWKILQQIVTQKMDSLYNTLRGKMPELNRHPQKTQTPQFYSFPSRIPTPNLPGTLSLSRDDVILWIDGKRIACANDCQAAVRNAGNTMEYVVRDSRDGTIWEMQTHLPRGGTRLDVELDDNFFGGAKVTHVQRGSPATRNKVVDRLDTLAEDGVTRWSAPIWRPEPGDHIIEVNGQKINNTNDFFGAVKNSPETMYFKLNDELTGKTLTMRTKLNPPTAKSRFGVGVSDCRHEGVSVDYVRSGYPGSRCQIAR